MYKRVTFEDKLFWEGNESSLKISPSKLIEFLSNHGFAKLLLTKNDYILVRVRRNKISEIKEFRISNHIQGFLKFYGLTTVYEAFVKGMASYINKSKLELLKSIPLNTHKDNKTSSNFYFENSYVTVTEDKIVENNYSNLEFPIWDKKIIKKEFVMPINSEKAQFEKFCFLVSGEEEDRFLSLKSIIGYLLHNYNNPINSKAIILVDERITGTEEANGGTGKGLIASAIGHCREMVLMDGKNYNSGSSFKFQRVEITTDVLHFDDVTSRFNLEQLYSMITSGIQIEKKYKDQVHISAKDSPKVLISSNYMVKGTGGSTDRRRRFEFELVDYFNDRNTPYDRFHHMFFDEWNDDEWNRFFLFMMNCLQIYLGQGLIPAKPINLIKNKIINATSIEFEMFLKEHFEINKSYDKRKFLNDFVEQYPRCKELSPHQFSKYLNSYASINGLVYKARSSGGNYFFKISDAKV